MAFRLNETTRLWRFFLRRIALALIFCGVFQHDVLGQVKLEDTKVMVDHFYHAYKLRIDSFEHARVFVDPILKSEYFVKVISNTTPQITDSLIIHQYNLLQLLTVYANRQDTDRLRFVSRMFYFLCIEDYCTTINDVVKLCQSKQLPCFTLNDFIYQDFTLSNNFAKHHSKSIVKQAMQNVLNTLRKMDDKACVRLLHQIESYGIGDDIFDSTLEKVQPPAIRHSCP
jgi:hypothetical protein